jgi:hypothetical protein
MSSFGTEKSASLVPSFLCPRFERDQSERLTPLTLLRQYIVESDLARVGYGAHCQDGAALDRNQDGVSGSGNPRCDNLRVLLAIHRLRIAGSFT